MSGSENGNGTHEHTAVISPGRVLGARSASPAKRSAADMMEGAGRDKSSTSGGQAPGSFTKEQQTGPTDYDEAMAGMTPVNDAMDTQETATNSLDTSARASMTTNTSATSFLSDAPPSYSVEDTSSAMSLSTDYTLGQIDEQVAAVRQKMNKELDEGQKGIVVSNKWLQRVLSRCSEGLKSSEYPKEAREGPIGPVDNSDIVPEGTFGANKVFLHDTEGRNFIPLKPGLSISTDFEVMNDDAWGLIVGAYGIAAGQKQIDRYVKNTAPADAPTSNLIYENYPPVFTIRKVQQVNNDVERPSTSSSSLQALYQKQALKQKGQSSPDDAIRLVSSREERFQKFLTRSKDAAGIPRVTKVRIFKLQDSKTTAHAPNGQQAGVISPPASRSTSPTGAETPNPKLVLDTSAFNEMEIGKELELLEVNDETNNSNYNGSSTMKIFGLFEDCTVLLEEMIGGPGGGEFASDRKKTTSKLSFGKKGLGSKPGSTTASGRTSPAPGGMTTRGRQRRDGRTRGTVGLTNLGNTCYMNSALQCIRSVEELAIYFLSETYKKEINHNNPLGHNGAMAKQYANVLQSIYAENAGGSVTPSQFKKTIGSIQPMFSGYGQQDSQEFLSFLVDALHEDLNRIQKKPYNENPDSDDKTVGDPEAIVKLGNVYRDNHAARNDSIAMDLFSGFYKNTMECPHCQKISITFDPYSLLTVQLPIENTFQHNVTFVPRRGRPINHVIDIDKNSTIKTLKEHIASKHHGVTADRLWMVEVYSHKLYKVFDDASTLAEASVQANDYLFIFELDAAPSNAATVAERRLFTGLTKSDIPEMDDPKADKFAVPVFSRQKNRFGTGWEIIMHPMYIVVTREEAQDYDAILKRVLVAISQMTTVPIFTDSGDSAAAEPTANGHTDEGEPLSQDNAQVTEHSDPSEDGYVKVSIDGMDHSHDEQMANGKEQYNDDQPVPKNLMDPEYFISPTLRNQLFTLNYAQGESNSLHCVGMQSIKENSVRVMFDRVKLPARRGSVQSSSTDEESTTSTGSGAQANGESEESDQEGFDKPDIVIGNGLENSLSLPTPTAEDSDNESLPENALDPMPISRKGRRKMGKHGKKGRRNNNKTYGKKGKRGHQNRPNSSGSLQSAQSHRSYGGKPTEEDENPYYIKLGEGIVLDWYPQALDHLFGGATADEDRGEWVSSPDGRGLPIFDDPEVQAKKSRRETRKKNGITLEDCFAETGKREVLSEDNAWYCNRCKELRRATKTLEIWTIPDILVVHLKRFGGNRSFRDKIDVFVDYPIESLDMTQKIGLKEDGKEYVYDLFAVDNHFGGLGGGHYTALAKNFFDGKWYDYNDASCSQVANEQRLKSAAAYLLFYRRRSDKPLGPEYLQNLVHDFRNPNQIESAEETAEESDSGEGRLGDPNGSYRGSSSALIGVGVGAGSRLGDVGSLHGTGAGVDSNLMTSMNPEDNSPVELPTVESIYAPLMNYGNQGSDSWNFKGLDEDAGADDVDTLISQVDDDDAGSMTTAMDMDRGYGGFSASMDQSFDDAEEYKNPSDFSTAGRNTPTDSIDGLEYGPYQDDHALYSESHEHQDADFDTLHLEDAGRIGEDGEEEELPTVELHPDPPTPKDEDEMMEDGKAWHEKLD